MGEGQKHIDDLVRASLIIREEHRALSKRIAESARPTIVVFVDLAGSTLLKTGRGPEEWLGYIYDFLARVAAKAEEAGGTVVKRIGDELMVTFASAEASERFFALLIADTALQGYLYKISVDSGNVYSLRFLEHLADDPYGSVVDRCARIAKLAVASTILCTGDYREQLAEPAEYASVARLPLRGFPEPVELFYRSLLHLDGEKYLEPLLNAVNHESAGLQGYRTVGRELTPEFVRAFGDGVARPFLARELLNIPRLPYSPKELSDVVRRSNNVKEREKDFIGYFVEWEGTFEEYERKDSYIALILAINSGDRGRYETLVTYLPLTWLEIVGELREGQRICARGLIERMFVKSVWLNYVDIDLIA